jgi:hypothetical protein
VTISASAQRPNQAATSRKARTAASSAPLRTPDGHPDLQGVWANDTITPLERPKQFAGKAFFDASEQAAFEAAVWAGVLANLGDENVKTSGDFQFDEPGNPLANRRTALIIDPPNGELPPLLPAAQLRVRESLDRRKQHLADGPEDFGLQERCITWPSPPMLPFLGNALLRIVQTHAYMVIYAEMFGEARVVPTDGRSHLPAAVRRWKGDSVGRWDGDTLVVDTTNLRADKDGTQSDLDLGARTSFYILQNDSASSMSTRSSTALPSTIQRRIQAHGLQKCCSVEPPSPCSSSRATKATIL